MPFSKLSLALSAVNWNDHVNIFLSNEASGATLASKNLRLAIWAREFEIADVGNPALCYIREMQVAGQYVAILVALALYKPAAACMRSMLEAALFYSYFRTHPSELETLARGTGYYLDKKSILDFHKEHTPKFTVLQQKLGVISRLESWYGRTSSLVHGHVPGAWVEHKSVSEIKPIKKTQGIVIDAFGEGVEIVHRFFLCSTGRQLWDCFSSQSKKQLLFGLHGDDKKVLGLDAA